jgi:tetratricopeptide (TPR) repeat protein
MAGILLFLRQVDEGIAEIRKALELDPVSIAISVDLGWTLGEFAGQRDEAIQHLKKTREMDPNNFLISTGQVWTYSGKGMYKEAAAGIAFREKLRLPP